MDLKLPFGLRNGKLVHITDITEEEKGSRCNCICPGCGQNLIARLGKVRSHHFAHSNSECSNALETALHYFAKEVLEKHMKLTLPALKIYHRADSTNPIDVFYNKYEGRHEAPLLSYRVKGISQSIEVFFDLVECEKKVDEIRPDIIVYKNGVPLIIEIAVTHYVDHQKYSQIKKLGYSTIEIDLGNSGIDFYNFDKEKLEELIITSAECKNWVFNRKAELEKQKLIEEKKQQAQKLTMNKVAPNKAAEKTDQVRIQNEERIKKLMLLLNNDNSKLLLQKYEAEIVDNPYWQQASTQLQVTQESIPEFLRSKVPGEFAIECDRRVWQSTILCVFIMNSQNRVIKVSDIIDWLKNKSPFSLNKDLIYTKDLKGYKAPDLCDAIFYFLKNLESYRILQRSDYGQSNYHAKFEILMSDIDRILNSTKVEKANKPKPKDDIQGYSVDRFWEVQAESQRRQAIRKEIMNQMKEITTEDENSNVMDNKTHTSHIYDRTGKCKFCGRITDDWVSYDLIDATCVCRKCRELL